MKKRLETLMMALCLVLALAVPAVAAETESGLVSVDDIEIDVADQLVPVSGYDGEIVVGEVEIYTVHYRTYLVIVSSKDCTRDAVAQYG